MRRRDLKPDLPDEDLPPSRSQLRREALEVFELAETLAALSYAELSRVPLADAVRD
jgi:ribosome-associated protein